MRQWGYLLKFSSQEFITQFIPNRSKASLAYFWLSCFFALAMTLSLVVIGAGAGITQRFADAVLGHVEGGGVPIQVQTATLNNRQIDAEVIKALDDTTGIKLQPYQEVTHYQLALPYCQTLEHKQVVGEQLANAKWWRGIAVSRNSPMWPAGSVAQASVIRNGTDKDISKTVFPRHLVLNQAVFTKHFDYQCYKQQLSENLPLNVIAQDLPQDITALSELKVLWLKTKGGNGYGQQAIWLPFTVDWVASIGGIDKTAFLMPLSTFQAYEFTQSFGQVRFFQEFDDKVGARFDQLAIYDHSFADFTGVDAAVTCLNRLLVEPQISYEVVGNDVYIQGLKYLPQGLIARCITNLPLANSAHEFVAKVFNTRVIYQPDSLAVLAECKAKPQSARYECHEGMFGARQVNFIYAWAFIADLTDLQLSLGHLQSFEVVDGSRTFKAFRFSDYYTDAIHRFDFIVSAVSAIAQVLVFVIGSFFVFIVTVKLAVLIGGRKGYFAKYLTSFLSVKQLYFSFCWQIGLAATIGFMFSLLATYFIRLWLNDNFQLVVQALGYNLNLDPNIRLDLLPLSFATYLCVLFGFMVGAWVICVTLLYRAKLTPKVEVTEYLVD